MVTSEMANRYPPRIGCIAQTPHEWLKQAAKDSAMRDGVTTEERDRIKAVEREVHEPS